MTDTYDNYEKSTEQGQPIEFYRFTLGSIMWFYTNADEDLTVGMTTWLTKAITDDGIKQKGDAQGESMTITCPDDLGPAVVYSNNPPGAELKVEKLRMHEGMTTLRVVYVGNVTQVGFPKPGQCSISVQALSASMRRTGLRLGYQRPCPYALYDQLTCKVDKTVFALAGYIRSIAGMTIVIDAAGNKPDGYFASGFIEWSDPVRGLERVMIESSIGSTATLTVFDDVRELAVGMPITIYPGCDQTPNVCKTRFNNYVNYGGWEYMPGKSPYDGNPIF